MVHSVRLPEARATRGTATQAAAHVARAPQVVMNDRRFTDGCR